MSAIQALQKETVSPNPFSHTTTFFCAEEDNYQLEIFDVTGKMVEMHRFYGKQFAYESSVIGSGIYYYEIRHKGISCNKGILIKD